MGGDSGQRNQVEAIVFEHGGERPGVARAHVLEVAGRNLEATDVTMAARAEDSRLE